MDAVTFQARPFSPAPWAKGPHQQTLFARVLRSGQGPDFARERVELPDGDFVDLDWGPDPGPTAPVALVMHGLEGSAKRRYVRNVCRELLGRGIRPVALNFRGCSGEPNRKLRFYHSGDTGDARYVLEMIRERYPDRRRAAMGFSLGGNVLLKLLGEDPAGAAELLDGAVAMSVPYELAAGCALLERSRMGMAYTGYFLRSLRAKVANKSEALAARVDLELVRSARTIWEFDDHFTAPLNGFDSAAHYYEECSSARFLRDIRTPTLLLHATDDPFLPADSIPNGAASENPALTLALHPHGGHVGFLEGRPWSPVFWGDEETARFLAHTCG